MLSGTNCSSIAEEAVRISDESNRPVKVIKVRALKIREDHRRSFRIPTGGTSVLVMSCTGEAVVSTGEEGVPVLLKMTVDSDGDYFVSYEDR